MRKIVIKSLQVMTVIMLCIMMIVPTYASSEPIICYDGTKKSLYVKNAKTDLFTKMKGLMPGDEVTQCIKIHTTHLKKETSLYIQGTSNDKELDAMSLTVIHNKKTISRAKSFAKVKLGTYGKDTVEQLYITLKVPKESTIADARYQINLKVTAQEDGEEIASTAIDHSSSTKDDHTGSHSGDDSNHSKRSVFPTSARGKVKTGDPTNVSKYIVMGLVALYIVIRAYQKINNDKGK